MTQRRSSRRALPGGRRRPEPGHARVQDRHRRRIAGTREVGQASTPGAGGAAAPTSPGLARTSAGSVDLMAWGRDPAEVKREAIDWLISEATKRGYQPPPDALQPSNRYNFHTSTCRTRDQHEHRLPEPSS